MGAVSVAIPTFHATVVSFQNMPCFAKFSHRAFRSKPESLQPSGERVRRFHPPRTFGPDIDLHKGQSFRNVCAKLLASFGFLFLVQVRKETLRRLPGHNVSQRIRKHVMEFVFFLGLIAAGPASSMCEVCFLSVRSSINWKRTDQRSPFGPFSSSPLCVTHFVTYIASIGSWM